MKMKSKIFIGIGVVVVLIVIAVLVLMSNLNGIVKLAIEKIGTNITGVPVRVQAVDIKLSEGSAAIQKLTVDNPKGFSNEKMIDLGELAVKADFKTGAINHIKIASPHFLFEQKGTTSNFQTLQDNLASEKPAEEEPTAPAEEGEATVLQIDLIELTDAQVKVVSDQLEEPKNLTIPSMTFKDLNGTGAEIGKQALKQLSEQIIKEVGGQVLKKELNKAIEKSLGEKLGGALDILKKDE